MNDPHAVDHAADRERALAADDLADLSAGDHQRRHHERVERDRGLDPGDRRPDVLGDRRDRHVHHRAVERHQELARRQRQQHQPGGAASTIRCLRHTAKLPAPTDTAHPKRDDAPASGGPSGKPVSAPCVRPEDHEVRDQGARQSSPGTTRSSDQPATTRKQPTRHLHHPQRLRRHRPAISHRRPGGSLDETAARGVERPLVPASGPRRPPPEPRTVMLPVHRRGSGPGRRSPATGDKRVSVWPLTPDFSLRSCSGVPI